MRVLTNEPLFKNLRLLFADNVMLLNVPAKSLVSSILRFNWVEAYFLILLLLIVVAVIKLGAVILLSTVIVL